MNKKILKICVALILVGPTLAIAAPVNVGGSEWMQVTDTAGFSWDDISAVCDPATGTCSSKLLSGTVNLSGWTWASAEEVGALFSMLTPHPGGITDYSETGSAWAPAFLSMFSPTLDGSVQNFVIGWSRTLFVPGISFAYAPVVQDLLDPADLDRADVGPIFDGSVPDPLVGGWFYRATSPPANVPEPSTIVLLGLSLAVLGFSRRRKVR